MEELKLFDITRKNIGQKLCKALSQYFVLLLIAIMAVVFGIHDYIFFHGITELFTVVVSASIAVVAINSYEVNQNNFFIFLGISHIFIAIYALLHIVTFPGLTLVHMFKYNNLSIEFAVIEQYYQAIAFLIACRYFNRSLDVKKTILWQMIISLGIIFPLIMLDIFNKLIITSDDINSFKIINTIILSLILIITLYILYIKREFLEKRILLLLASSVVLELIINQLQFMGSQGDNLYQKIAHGCYILAYYALYKALTETGLREPYKVLFYELNCLNGALREKNVQLQQVNEELQRENLERKKTEEALRDSETRYRLLMDMLPDSVIIHDGMKINYANKEAAKLVGLEHPRQMLGIELMELIHEDYKEEVLEHINTIIREKREMPPVPRLLRRLDGTVIEVECNTAPFYSQGTLLQIVICRDTSERRKAENNIRLLNEAMEYDKVKTEFFANISHELRTPINVIYGALQLVDYYNENIDEEKRNDIINRYNKIMKQNCYRLLRLVNNLIDITKIDAGYYQMHMKNYNIVSVVEDITLSVVDYVAQKNITLEFDTEVEEKYLACDADKIERIILNLLSNAVKFTPSGGKITVNIDDKGDFIDISIKDSGIGIPEDNLQIIFERFRQVDKSLTRSNEGSGIGLSLVKSLVEMHGGTIKVKSIWGQGSEFIVSLPVVLKEEEEVEEIAVTTESKVHTTNIEFSDIYN